MSPDPCLKIVVLKEMCEMTAEITSHFTEIKEPVSSGPVSKFQIRFTVSAGPLSTKWN